MPKGKGRFGRDRYTEDRSHDPDAGVLSRPVWAADAEFGQRRQAGRGELRAAAFGRHGFFFFLVFFAPVEDGCYR